MSPGSVMNARVVHRYSSHCMKGHKISRVEFLDILYCLHYTNTNNKVAGRALRSRTTHLETCEQSKRWSRALQYPEAPFRHPNTVFDLS
jgi:hypothetical protein